jgi:tight adherence protein C
MILLAFMALGLLGFAIVMFYRAAATTRLRMLDNLSTIAAHGYGPESAALPTPVSSDEGRIDRLATSLGERFGPRLSFMQKDETQRRLIAAGFYATPARRFLGYQMLATIVLVVLALWLAVVGGASFGIGFLLVALAVLIAWGGPHYYVSRRATQRLQAIDEALPELIDLLAVTIEAGLAFGASLRVSAERLSGPLGDELRLTLQEQSLGLSPAESLDNWLERTDTPAVRAFVRAMTQGERLGISVGQILRNLAVEMRKRRRAVAEERAQKAPIKILFPLVFLIFPALFVIVLGPAAYAIVQSFSGK